MKKIIKPLLITCIVLCLIVGGLYGGYRYNLSKKTASVVSLSTYAMTDYWGDSISSYGQVTSDKAQTAYLEAGTEVLSLLVSEGDHVNEGDVILTIKKESQDINDKKLQIAKAEQELKFQQIKLNRLQNTTPVATYTYSQDVYNSVSYVETIEYHATEEFSDGYGGSYDSDKRSLVAKESFDYDGNSLGMTYYIHKVAKDDEGNDKTDDDGNPIYESINVSTFEGDLGADTIKNSSKIVSKSIEGEYEYLKSTTYYDAETHKMIGETSYSPDGEVVDEKKVPTGMNANELANEIASVEENIKKQDLSVRKLYSQLDVMENTDDSGEIKAKVSGTVSKLQNKDNYNSSQPFFIVTATDEYYISGSIGEFYLDSVHVGDSVTINSWENNVTTDAQIIDISDTPYDDNDNFYSGSGNNNSSSYEFKASFDRSSGIEIGSYVEITINPTEEEASGTYIPSYFIRKDAAGSYVMRMSGDNTLEKVYIKIGKSLWGQMTEVKSEISADDYLAFPYGTGAVEGIKCQIIEYLDYDTGGGLG